MAESNYWLNPDTSTDIMSTGSTSLDAAVSQGLSIADSVMKSMET